MSQRSRSTGSIEIIMGCMFSGKTTELIMRYKKWSAICKNVLCINYAEDIRYGSDSFVYNHDNIKIECVLALKLESVDKQLIDNASVILINEGQFFPDLVEYCKLWADHQCKHIIVSGLDGDYKREKFGHLLDLIPLADDVQKITAFCVECKDTPTPALFTHRLSHENDQKVIGSSNYIALCRYHYLEINKSEHYERQK